MPDYTASIENEPLIPAITRLATSYKQAARLAATEGQNGEIIAVLGPKGARTFRIINRFTGETA